MSTDDLDRLIDGVILRQLNGFASDRHVDELLQRLSLLLQQQGYTGPRSNVCNFARVITGCKIDCGSHVSEGRDGPLDRAVLVDCSQYSKRGGMDIVCDYLDICTHWIFSRL